MFRPIFWAVLNEQLELLNTFWVFLQSGKNNVNTDMSFWSSLQRNSRYARTSELELKIIRKEVAERNKTGAISEVLPSFEITN
jgi:hypothetical protein